MENNDPQGRWVRGEDLHPMVNVFRRKWRFIHMDGSVTSGTFWGDNYPQFHPSAIEWFFPATPTDKPAS